MKFSSFPKNLKENVSSCNGADNVRAIMLDTHEILLMIQDTRKSGQFFIDTAVITSF